MIIIIKSVLNKFNDLSIKFKLFLAFLSLIALPMLLFLFVNTYISSSDNEKQSLYSAHQVLSQTKSFLEFKTESARNALNFIASNDKIQDILERTPDEYEDDIGLWYIDTIDLSSAFFPVKSNPDIYKVHYYMMDGPASVFKNDDILDLEEFKDSNWYKRLMSRKNVVQWFGKNNFQNDAEIDCIYAIRKISKSQNINENIAVIKIDIPVIAFESILNQAIFTKASSCLLINSYNEIICASSNNSINSKEDISDIVSVLPVLADGQGTWKTINYNNEKILVGAHEIENSDWKLLLVTPYEDILSLNNKNNKRMIYIFFIIAPLTLPLAFFTAASATKRIKMLTYNMRNAVNMNFNLPILPMSNDEIGELSRNFNYMLTKISMLIDEKYDLGKKFKNLELKALQAQINPHFLYNTLDLINWMSIIHKAPDISKVVETLSKFYKLSLSKGNDIVTIQNELDHIEAYVQIQNMRFENRIELEIDVPTDIRECRILKLIFQPIVENSILHGILETDDEAGKIIIRGKKEGTDILLFIEDNGVGMDEEKAFKLLDGTCSADKHEHHGYGINNINDRLKLNFGADYGLSYTSFPGKGTTAIIKIPSQNA